MSAIIPCLFGTTQGFEIVELAPMPFKMKDLLVAITHGEVELSLEDACFKVLRIKSDNVTYTWIGLYRKAYEMGFSREGGYYGAGVWLAGTTVDARHALDTLEDLSQQIRKLAMNDRKFLRPLADIVSQLGLSPALSALINSKAAYARGGISADARNCAFISQPQSARDIVAWAQSDPLAHNFQSVIIAPASTFPKAGASGHIRQYADITALERALERDYVARLTKADGLNKDLQKRVQSLEAELTQRKTEAHSLAQKNAQLEGAVARARMLAAQDKYGPRGGADGDDKEELSLGHPSIVAPFTFVVSVLLSMGLFYYLTMDLIQPGQLEEKLNEQRAQLAADKSQALQSQKEEFESLIAEMIQARDQAEQNRAQRSEEARTGQKPAVINLGHHPNGEPIHASPEDTAATSTDPQQDDAAGGAASHSDAEPQDTINPALPAQHEKQPPATDAYDGGAMADLSSEASEEKIVQLSSTERSILARIGAGQTKWTDLQNNTGLKTDRLAEILNKLVSTGFIERKRRGLYGITESGIQHLSDEKS